MKTLQVVCPCSCVLAVLLAGLVARADTHTATGVTYAEVNAAVSAASSGDTVVVPAGTATWSSELIITKGIILKGAGIGSTVITGNITDNVNQGGGVIFYKPASGVNDPFRVTGFTIDGGGMSNCILIFDNNVVQTQIRIDHNSLSNPGNPNAGGSKDILIFGDVYGVIDNNTFTGGNAVGNRGFSHETWSRPFAFGSVNNMYIEDNNMTSAVNAIIDSTQAGRYVCRYNSFTSSTNAYPIFDIHGNMSGGIWGTQVAEIYGNSINVTGGTGHADLVDHRGGELLCFFNTVTAASLYSQLREEYPDNVDGDNTDVQHVNNSYYWNNRLNGTTLTGTGIFFGASGTATGGGSNYILCNNGFTSSTPERYGLYITAGKGAGDWGRVSALSSTQITIDTNYCYWPVIPDATSQYIITGDCDNVLFENQQFWNHQASFNGAVGMGAGTLANRPSTCTVGVGYWATNQDCTQVSNANCGAHPSSPLSGTLYLCTATNTWTASYSPYTYPHPLRVSGPLSDPDTTPPSPPPAVRDGTGSDISTTSSTTQLSANWDASTDNESGITGYQYAIGTSAGGTQTVNWTTLGNVTTVTKTGLSLTIGQTYYFSVKAINGAGLTGSATNSNGQTVIDTTPPSAPPTVRDGTETDIAYTTSTTQLSANWDASTDNESGISGYQYAIGTSAGGTQTVNWTSLGNVTTVTKTGLALTSGQTYYFSVKAVNGAGLTGSATNSNGQTVDSTAPSAPPAVRDGTGTDISTTSSTTQVSANWDASTDNESGISGYQYAIGTSAGGTQTVNWTSLGNVTTVTKNGLTLTVGQTYFFSVKAVNGAGLIGSATNSNGQTVVTSATVTYFQDNFESWTAHGGLWSSVNGETSTQTLNTSTDYAKAGAKSLKLTDTDTTSTTGAFLTKTFSPAISGNIYVRFFVYLPTGYTSANAGCASRRLLRVWCGSNRGQISLYNGATPLMEEVGSWGNSTASSALSENAWHCIEMYMATPSASTPMQYWVDGTSAGTLNGSFSGSTTYDHIELGDVSLGGGTNGNGTYYLDELVVSNSYVGTGIASPVTYFQDAFDSWSVHGGAWSSVSGETSTHTLNTSTDYARSGTKSLKLTDTDTTSTSGAFLVENFSPAISGDVYVRFYVYLPTGYASTNSNCNRRVLQILAGSNKALLVVVGDAVYVQESIGWNNSSRVTISEAQWHGVEMHATAPAAVTVLEYWIDGVYGSAVTANYSAASTWTPINVGDPSTGGGSNGTGTFYLDQVIVSDTYNGLLP